MTSQAERRRRRKARTASLAAHRLTAAPAAAPVVQLARAKADRAAVSGAEDGLEWLIRKGRLSSDRIAAAKRYRAAYRDAGGVPVPSNLALLTRVQGGAGGGVAPLILEICADARAWLQVIRLRVLANQPDMLEVMDGVVGGGLTLRALAGGNGHEAKALERVLKVALDLVAAHRETGIANVHEIGDQRPLLRSAR